MASPDELRPLTPNRDRFSAGQWNIVRKLLARRIAPASGIVTPDEVLISSPPGRTTRGAGARTIRFRVVSSAPYVDEYLPICTSVLATVEDISCGASSPDIGDYVIVWDPSDCWFTIPMDSLEGAYGTAVEMARTGYWDVILDCLEGASLDGTCWWMVTGLCCAENVYGG